MVPRLHLLVPWAAVSLACTPLGQIGETPRNDGGTTNIDGGTIPNVLMPSGDQPVLPSCLAPLPSLLSDEASTGGGPIQGSLTVYVTSAAGPVNEVVIKVATDTVDLEGSTDSAGCISFEHPDLAGPVHVHAFPPDTYGYRSHLGLDAAQIVVSVEPTTADTPQGTAILEGEVFGLARTATMSSTVGAAATLRPTSTLPLRQSLEQPRKPASPHYPSNWAIIGGPGFQLTDYLLVADPERTHTLVAYAGPAYFDPATLTALADDLHYFGFLTEVNVQPNERLTGLDLSITHSANVPTRWTWGRRPELEHLEIATRVWFPNGREFFPVRGLIDGDPKAATILVPALTGALEGGGYSYFIQTFMDEGQAVSTVAGLPGDETHFDIGDLPEIPAQVQLTERTVTAQLDPNIADLVVVVLEADQVHMWKITDWSPSPNVSIRFPEVPSGYIDPIKTSRFLYVTGSNAVTDTPQQPQDLNPNLLRWSRQQVIIND